VIEVTDFSYLPDIADVCPAQARLMCEIVLIPSSRPARKCLHPPPSAINVFFQLYFAYWLHLLV
jgi:hypothetical protein